MGHKNPYTFRGYRFNLCICARLDYVHAPLYRDSEPVRLQQAGRCDQQNSKSLLRKAYTDCSSHAAPSSECVMTDCWQPKAAAPTGKATGVPALNVVGGGRWQVSNPKAATWRCQSEYTISCCSGQWIRLRLNKSQPANRAHRLAPAAASQWRRATLQLINVSVNKKDTWKRKGKQKKKKWSYSS